MCECIAKLFLSQNYYVECRNISQKCKIGQCSLICMRFAIIKEFTVPPGTQRELSSTQRQST